MTRLRNHARYAAGNPLFWYVLILIAFAIWLTH
jgi:hypothetical protein